jgi:predicted nuclease with TOPRIM domain
MLLAVVLLILVCIVASVVQRLEPYIDMTQAMSTLSTLDQKQQALEDVKKRKDILQQEYSKMTSEIGRLNDIIAKFSRDPKSSDVTFTDNDKLDIQSWQNKLEGCNRDVKEIQPSYKDAVVEGEQLGRQLDFVKIPYDAIMDQITNIKKQQAEKQEYIKKAKQQYPELSQQDMQSMVKLQSCLST